MTSHPAFVQEYEPQKGYRMFVFKLSDEIKQKVVEPFLRGEYSKVDRSYVEKFFPNNPNHNNYPSRLVFDKSNLTREYWEDQLGTTLPLDAEVWSKPTKSQEIYGYIETLPAEGTKDFSESHGELYPELASDQELGDALAD